MATLQIKSVGIFMWICSPINIEVFGACLLLFFVTTSLSLFYINFIFSHVKCIYKNVKWLQICFMFLNCYVTWFCSIKQELLCAWCNFYLFIFIYLDFAESVDNAINSASALSNLSKKSPMPQVLLYVFIHFNDLL